MDEIWKVDWREGQPIVRVSELREALLAQREIGAGEAESFFEPSYEREIHDPYLLFGMREAVDRIYKAVQKGEQILVYGDYDVDGISSMAILVSALSDLGAKVSPYLPHRLEDGYGLNLQVLKKIVEQFDLLITVDCGVSNEAEVAWLKKQGKDVIITDHHSLPTKLPAALAVLHPMHPKAKYPFSELCGAGVSWKLAQALLRDSRSPLKEMTQEIGLLELACLGTIADMVPLKGENRAIVQFGLRGMSVSQRPGIRALLRALVRDDDISAEMISYRVAPLLNAAGRLGHAQPALDLLLSVSENRASRQMETLRQYNARRRLRSKQIMKEAEQQVIDIKAPMVFAADAAWEPGVVGLVAGRLSEKFQRPAVVIGGGGGVGNGFSQSAKGSKCFGFN